MAISSDDVRAGQAFYNRWTLAWYDAYVLGLSCRLAWKCPAQRILDLYNANVSANHLELGVGTGYFLDRCTFPVREPRIVLVDLNRSCLAAAAQRIARYQPEQFVRNALAPFEFEGRMVDSAGLNFVLHCLPGTMYTKGAVFDHLRAVVKPGGVIFGSTILWHGVEHGFLAKRLTSLYNRRRIFTNFDDTLDALREVLAARFREYEVRTIGSVALFRAHA